MKEPADKIAPAKTALRKRMRKLLLELNEADRHDASHDACSRVLNLEPFLHADVVMMYMPLQNEVDVTPVAVRAFQMGKTVCVPRVDWNRKDMHAVEVNSFDDHVMETNEHGIRSPRDGRLVVPSTIDLIIVPGLAFDTSGHRLGRGGGYYDRFLARLRPNAPVIGLAFDLQVVESVPVDAGDRPVDLVVTNRRVTHTRASRSGR
jgi:5-formyltetrahydrofolate cyclo-ligase